MTLRRCFGRAVCAAAPTFQLQDLQATFTSLEGGRGFGSGSHQRVLFAHSTKQETSLLLWGGGNPSIFSKKSYILRSFYQPHSWRWTLQEFSLFSSAGAAASGLIVPTHCSIASLQALEMDGPIIRNARVSSFLRWRDTCTIFPLSRIHLQQFKWSCNYICQWG